MKKPLVLTQDVIAAMRPGDYRADAAEPGLRVVASKGCKSFVYRFRDLETRMLRQVTIGDAAKDAISDMRTEVAWLKKERKDGNDPRRLVKDEADEKVTENLQLGYTFKRLIDDYAREKLSLTKRGAERERMLRADLPKWPHREAAAIARKEVKTMVATIGIRTPDTAGRVLRELRLAYGHAAYLERIPDDVDPTAGVKPPEGSTYVPRNRAFSEREWRTWLKWLPISGMSGDVCDALRLVALTACRPGEATAAVWRDIDLDSRSATWTIPVRKRDGGRHVVYLSAPARALLRARRNDSPFVFPSPTKAGRPIREHALVWQISSSRAASPLAHWTAHDLRRSAATLMQQGKNGASHEVLRRILGHYSTRNPTDIYARHTFDTEARAAWTALGTKLAKWGAL